MLTFEKRIEALEGRIGGRTGPIFILRGVVEPGNVSPTYIRAESAGLLFVRAEGEAVDSFKDRIKRGVCAAFPALQVHRIVFYPEGSSA